MWIVFAIVLGSLLALDLTMHARHVDSRRAAVLWSIAWVAVGLSFSLYVAHAIGGDAAGEYLAAYLIEESLSLDNLFVFLVIFTALNIPKKLHHRALSWGIFGALVFRGVFIAAGVEALRHWQWIEFIFAGGLAYAAIHAALSDPREQRKSRIVTWLSKHLPIAKDSSIPHLFVRENGRRLATPLLVAILALEFSDILFAVDSVPAALAVSRVDFVVYTSNAFAILGLRALFIVLEDLVKRLVYLNYGLAMVLGFAAFKMAVARWIHISPLLSVGVVVAILAATVLLSVRAGSGQERRELTPSHGTGTRDR